MNKVILAFLLLAGIAGATGAIHLVKNFSPAQAATSFQETWTGEDGDPWPAGWEFEVISGHIHTIDIQNGRGRIAGASGGFYHVDQIHAYREGTSVSNSEMLLGYVKSNDVNSSRGFFARHAKDAPNTYYRLYQRGIGDGIAISRVVEGEATTLAWGGFSNKVAASMKALVQQTKEGTELKFKIWRAGNAEPEEWNLEVVDDHPALRNAIGRSGIYAAPPRDHWQEFDDFSLQDTGPFVFDPALSANQRFSASREAVPISVGSITRFLMKGVCPGSL